MAGINVPIRVEAKQARQEISAFNKEMRHVRDISNLTTKELEAQGNQVEAVATKQQSFSEQLRIQTEITDRYKVGLQASKETLEEKRKELESSTAAWEAGKLTMAENSTELKTLEKTVAQSTKHFDAASQRVTEWGRGLEKSEAQGRLLQATVENTTQGIQTQSEAMSAFGEVLRANLVADALIGSFNRLIGGIGRYLTQGAVMAEQMSLSQSQLAHVMGNTMDATQGQIDAINQLTSAQQQLGVVSQTAQVAGAQELATNLENYETLKKLIPVMNDMAAHQYGINANTQNTIGLASTLGRVMNGNVRAIERMGHAFTEAQEAIIKYGTEAERAAVLVEVISASVGGINQALADTELGQQAQLNMVLAETQERVGDIYNSLRTQLGADVLPAIEAVFSEMLEFIENNRDSIAGLMGVLQGLFSFFLQNSRMVVAALSSIGGGIAAMRLTETIAKTREWITALQAAAAAKTTTMAATTAQTAATLASTTAIKAKIVTVKALTAAMLKSPFAVGALLVGGVMAVIQVVSHLNGQFKRQAQLVRDLSDEYQTLQNDLDGTARQITNVSRRIDELQSKDTLTLIEKEELAALEQANTRLETQLQIQRQLQDLAAQDRERETIELLISGRNPAIEQLTRQIKLHDELTQRMEKFQEKQTQLAESGSHDNWAFGLTEEWIANYQERIVQLSQTILEKGSQMHQYRGYLVGVADGYEEVALAVDNALAVFQNFMDARDFETNINQTVDGVKQAVVQTETLTTASQEVGRAVKDLIEAYRTGEMSSREYTEALQNQLAQVKAITAANPKLADSFAMVAYVIQRQLANSPKYLQGLQQITSELAREIDMLRGALDEQTESGELNLSTVMRLIEAGYAAALQIDQETGAVILNTDAYMRLMEAKLASHEAELKMARLQIQNRLDQEREATRRLAEETHHLTHAKLEAVRASRIAEEAALAEIAALEHQINIINRLRANLDTPLSTSRPQTSRGGTSSRQAEAEAQRTQREEERKAEEYRREQVAAWENYYREREEQERHRIERERFFRRLSFDDEVSASENMLAFLRQRLTEVGNIAEATEEEKSRIRRDILSRIDRYERQIFSANLTEDRELARDAQYAARRIEEGLQREAAATQDSATRHNIYAQLRVAIDTRMRNEMAAISERYWLTEREKLREMEASHRTFARDIENIDRRMFDLRHDNLLQYATQWKAVELERLDGRRRAVDQNHNNRRQSLNRELESLREHYAALDAEEQRWDRSRQMADLQQEEAIFKNAATRQGQQRHRQIVSQIENLQQQDERQNQNHQRQQEEEAIRERIARLDTSHQRQIHAIDRQREALQNKYAEMQEAASKLAQDTSKSFMDAGTELTDGLTNLYKLFGQNMEQFAQKQIVDVTNLASTIKNILSQVQIAFGTAGTMVGTAVNNVNNSRSVVLNQNGANHFHGQQDMARSWHEMSILALNGLGSKV